MIYRVYLAHERLNKLTPDDWIQIKKTLNDLPSQLNVTVHGNHFSFPSAGERVGTGSMEYLM
jgi:hypothetical protein